MARIHVMNNIRLFFEVDILTSFIFPIHVLSSRTYNELISTGNLNLVSNDEIRNKIVDYYDSKEFTEEYLNNIRTEYASYFNSLRVYNPKFRDSVNPVEIPRILKLIQTEKFLGLINQEMTYAFSIFRRLEFNKNRAHKLHLKIEENIKKQN